MINMNEMNNSNFQMLKVGEGEWVGNSDRKNEVDIDLGYLSSPMSNKCKLKTSA